MKPCPTEAAATLLDELAARPDGHRPSVARALERVPLVHALRSPEDRCLAMARAVESGQPEPDAMRACAAELRAGAPAMRARGWWPTVGGRAAA